jgi:DNA-binding beta-propeller fold protein YncE
MRPHRRGRMLLGIGRCGIRRLWGAIIVGKQIEALNAQATGGDIGASPQLACGIANSAGGKVAQNVIFITPDAGYNQASLRIALTSGKTTMAPGAIPDPDSPPGPGAGSAIYVDLSALRLSADVWDKMTFDGAGWAFRKFPGQGVVGMTPAGSPLSLSSGTAGAIMITIHGIAIPAAPPAAQVQVYVAYYNIPDVPGMYSTFAVAIQNAPDQEADLSGAIGASLSANGIVNTVEPLAEAANQFALQFTNLQGAVKAGPDTTFSVCFVCGAPRDPYGYGALTDATRANAFSVTAGDNAEGWSITRDSNAQAVTWTLQPPGDAPIVGTGAQSVVTINFSSVVTTYQPGPTVMLVSYREIPGYRDGTFTLLLNKIPHVVIQAFDVTPNPAHFRGRTAKVAVSWQVSGARSVELTQGSQATPVTGKTELRATLDAELTTFTLKATGQPGTADNSDYRTIRAIALPVIKSFIGSPTEIYHGTPSHEVSFSWTVDSADDVTLASTAGAFAGQSFRPVGRTSVSITEPQMVTLAPKTATDPLTLARRLVISAFRPWAATRTLVRPAASPAAIASPVSPFLLVAEPATKSLAVVETFQLTKIGAQELGHAVSALAFSADGGTLVTANTDNTVSVFAVTYEPPGRTVFGAQVTVPLAGTPQQLVFSPDGRRIFVTLDPGGEDPGPVVSLLRSPGGYQVEASITVGFRPRGLTLDAAGGRLFVANLGDNSVSVIGLTDGKPDATSTIHGITGGPIGIVLTPDGKRLLVACEFNGTVVAFNPDHPGEQHVLRVGESPGQIALLPGGSYAAVTDVLEATVRLVDYSGQLRTVGPDLAVGGGHPLGITATPDGLQLLVGLDDTGFGIVILETYEASNRVSVPNQPTDVAFSADGDSVFAWHDAQIPAQSPSPGIVVRRRESGTISNLLAGQNVLHLAVSPDPLAAEAFAIVEGDPALRVIATDTLETVTHPLELAPGSVPVALAVSGEGRTLFAVASDADRDLSLVVLEKGDQGWAKIQTLALYRAAGPGRILLRPTPDGTTLFLADATAAQVRVLRRAGPGYVLSPTTIPGAANARGLAVLPDGSAAYLLDADHTTNTVTVIDVASLSWHAVVLPQPGAASSPSVSLTGLQPAPDGRRLFAADANTGALYVLDPRSLRNLQKIQLGTFPGDVAGVSGLAVRPDGSGIVTANTVSRNLSFIEQIQMADVPAAGKGR